MTQSLDILMQKTGLWRASRIDCEYKSVRSTGFKVLDDELPGGGWPSEGVTELLHDQYGIGELRLLLPTITQLSQGLTRWLLMVNPPYIPYPPTLAQAGVDLSKIIVSQTKTVTDYLWAIEKALSSQSCSLVLCWPRKIHAKQIKRMQVASKEGNCWAILFRPGNAATHSSPADLRIQLRPSESKQNNSTLIARVLKRKGGWGSRDLLLEFSDRLQEPMPEFSKLNIEQPERHLEFRLQKNDQQHPPAHEYQ